MLEFHPANLTESQKFVKTVRKHQDRILSFVGSGASNAIAEGINRVIRQIKNRASGFRNVSNFMNLIFLCKGDLDIAAQIDEIYQVWYTATRQDL